MEINLYSAARYLAADYDFVAIGEREDDVDYRKAVIVRYSDFGYYCATMEYSIDNVMFDQIVNSIAMNVDNRYLLLDLLLDIPKYTVLDLKCEKRSYEENICVFSIGDIDRSSDERFTFDISLDVLTEYMRLYFLENSEDGEASDLVDTLVQYISSVGLECKLATQETVHLKDTIFYLGITDEPDEETGNMYFEYCAYYMNPADEEDSPEEDVVSSLYMAAAAPLLKKLVFQYYTENNIGPVSDLVDKFEDNYSIEFVFRRDEETGKMVPANYIADYDIIKVGFIVVLNKKDVDNKE